MPGLPIGRRSKTQTERLRQIVYERDNHECVSKALYGPCSADITIQHRVGRGMGGSALYDAHSAFLVVLCGRHNTLETANADYHKLCRQLGWSVPRWVIDRWHISEVPVFYWDGWHYLAATDRVPTTPETATGRMKQIYGESYI